MSVDHPLLQCLEDYDTRLIDVAQQKKKIFYYGVLRP